MALALLKRLAERPTIATGFRASKKEPWLQAPADPVALLAAPVAPARAEPGQMGQSS